MTPESRQSRFREELPKLLAQHAGKYALVCRGRVQVFEREADAIKAGFDLCGRPNDFLVSRIEPEPIKT